MVLAFKGSKESARFLAEKFGESYIQIPNSDYWVWLPSVGSELKLLSVEVGLTIVEKWLINGEQFVIERYDTHDEIYQPIKW